MRAKNIDAVVYKLPGGKYEVCPLDGTTASVKKLPKPAPAPAPKPAATATAPKKPSSTGVVKKPAGAGPVSPYTKAKPKTLDNFEKHRDGLLDQRYKSARLSAGNDRVQRALQMQNDAIENAVTRSRTSQSSMKLVMKDGCFKTQIELQNNRSGGWYNPDGRKKASNDLFGTDIAKTPRNEYEYYGYLWDDDFATDFKHDGPSQYGGGTVQFKPDVRSRTTFTIGDSLHAPMVPSYLDDPTPAWRISIDETNSIIDGMKSPTVEALKRSTRGSYIEAQYHGRVTLADVESYVLGPDEADRLDKPMLRELNEKWGIKIGVVTHTSRGYQFRWLTAEELR